MSYTNPFIINSEQPPCDDGDCTPCIGQFTPIPTEDCFICGYPHEAFDECRSQSTPCLDGSVKCLDCESVFNNIEFLGGYVAGFSSKLGFGASESTVNIDLVVLKNNNCDTQPTPSIDCSTPIVCNKKDNVYTGQIGYLYTFHIGSFCFRGILTNHSYTEDSSGFKYKVNLTDGRNILSGCTVLLNGFYDPVPDELQPNLINLVRESEPSIYNDQCGLLTKCDNFMYSGSNQKGILLKDAISRLHLHCISVPISGAGLKLNLNRLIQAINTEARTTNQESTVLELIDLACQESGLAFFTNINNNNEIEVFPVNYKIDISGTDLFNFVENLNNNDIVISKDYGQEMTLEKTNRVLYGAEYCYITRITDTLKNVCDPTLIQQGVRDCKIEHAPWQQPDVRSSRIINGDAVHIDYPIIATQPTGCKKQDE